METYKDFLQRLRAGPYMEEPAWDLEVVARTTAELVRKYKLSWNAQELLNVDSGTIDAVFEAGVELAHTAGVYHRDAKRVVRFSREEIETRMRAMPQSLSLGEGKDARVLSPRRVMDPRPPLVWAGNPGAPIPERYYLQYVMMYAQEPLVDFVAAGSLTTVDGCEVRTGGPMEIVATRRELEYVRLGTRKVGRPGMGALVAQSAVTGLGDVSVANPSYMRHTDAHLVPMLNELKIDDGNLMRVVNSIGYGVANASLPCVIVGGLGGDAPGSAVVTVASLLLSSLVCRSDYHILHPIHIRHVATSTRSVLWVENVVSQAFSRNAPCIVFGDIYAKSGALTTELLYETAANAIVLTLAGSHLEGPATVDGAAPNCSSVEARLMAEVGQAVSRQGMSLEEANALVVRLLGKYEHVFDRPGGNPGVPLDQAIDLDTLRPVPAWSSMDRTVRVELREMGLSELPART